MVKLIHGADFHLDSPFAGLTPEGAARRRGEQRELLDRLAALANDRGADLVLLSGDLLDGERVFRETVQTLARALGQIRCPVFLAPGNHDWYSQRSPYATLRWPDNVHIFTGPQMEAAELPALNCVVHGAAFTAPRLERSPLSHFRAEADGRVHLGVLHGDMDGQGGYGPLSEQDAADSGLSYLALGHVHQYSGPRRAGGTVWSYPGCPEGRGFDELGEKGVVWVQAEPESVQLEFVPLCRRRYEILSVDLTGRTDAAAAVLQALPAGTEQDIYRVLLTGERGAEPLELAALTRELAPRFYGLTLRDRTRAARALWARRGEDTLTGLFLQEMEGRCAQDPDSEELQLAVRFGLAALEHGEDVAL